MRLSKGSAHHPESIEGRLCGKMSECLSARIGVNLRLINLKRFSIAGGLFSTGRQDLPPGFESCVSENGAHGGSRTGGSWRSGPGVGGV